MTVTFPADYHMHTPLCWHAVGEPVDYAAQAVQVGLKEIGFSEHNPFESFSGSIGITRRGKRISTPSSRRLIGKAWIP